MHIVLFKSAILSVPPFLQVYMYIWSIIAQMIYICLTIILTS